MFLLSNLKKKRLFLKMDGTSNETKGADKTAKNEQKKTANDSQNEQLKTLKAQRAKLRTDASNACNKSEANLPYLNIKGLYCTQDELRSALDNLIKIDNAITALIMDIDPQSFTAAEKEKVFSYQQRLGDQLAAVQEKINEIKVKEQTDPTVATEVQNKNKEKEKETDPTVETEVQDKNVPPLLERKYTLPSDFINLTKQDQHLIYSNPNIHNNFGTTTVGSQNMNFPDYYGLGAIAKGYNNNQNTLFNNQNTSNYTVPQICSATNPYNLLTNYPPFTSTQTSYPNVGTNN